VSPVACWQTSGLQGIFVLFNEGHLFHFLAYFIRKWFNIGEKLHFFAEQTVCEDILVFTSGSAAFDNCRQIIIHVMRLK
jgi:hypothetical protein